MKKTERRLLGLSVLFVVIQAGNASAALFGWYQWNGEAHPGAAVSAALIVFPLQLWIMLRHFELLQQRWMPMANDFMQVTTKIGEENDLIWRRVACRSLQKLQSELKSISSGAASYTTADRELFTFESVKTAASEVTTIFHIRSIDSIRLWKKTLKKQYLTVNQRTAQRLSANDGSFTRVFRLCTRVLEKENVNELFILFDHHAKHGIRVRYECEGELHKPDFVWVDRKRLHVFDAPESDHGHTRVTVLLTDENAMSDHMDLIRTVLVRSKEWPSVNNKKVRDEVIKEIQAHVMR